MRASHDRREAPTHASSPAALFGDRQLTDTPVRLLTAFLLTVALLWVQGSWLGDAFLWAQEDPVAAP